MEEIFLLENVDNKNDNVENDQTTSFKSPEEDLKIIVFDLGGGTYDVSLIEYGQSIFETLKNTENPKDKINNLITYLIKAIPVPHKNSKVSFSLPYINRICDLYYPYFQDILLFGNNPMIILEHFSINNIISIFKL